MTLVIDAGVTFLKWATVDDGMLGATRSAVHHGVDPAEWQAALAQTRPVPTRVVVANVAGPVLAQRLGAWVMDNWGMRAEFPQAQHTALGVTNGFASPALLGIDRWLAMVGAYAGARRPLLAVSAGTAFTIDLVDGSGAHRGGCAVPGARLMRESLHAHTNGVAAAAMLDAPMVVGSFGVNTAGAVQQGARLALAGLTEDSARILERETGTSVGIFLTGGAAPQVASLMRCPVTLVPDLVLRGLALTLGEIAA